MKSVKPKDLRPEVLKEALEMIAADRAFERSAELFHADLARRMGTFQELLKAEEARRAARTAGSAVPRVTWSRPPDEDPSDAAVCPEDDDEFDGRAQQDNEKHDDEEEEELHPLGRSVPLPRYIAPRRAFCSEYQEAFTPSLRDSRANSATLDLAYIQPLGMYTSECQASFTKASKPKSSKSSKGKGKGLRAVSLTLDLTHPLSDTGARFLLSGTGLRRLQLDGLRAGKLVAGKATHRVLGRTALASRPYALSDGYKSRWVGAGGKVKHVKN